MIIQCDRCKSRFRLDEALLDPDGTKVRCSICSNIFRAFPTGSSQASSEASPDLDTLFDEPTTDEDDPFAPFREGKGPDISKSDAEIDYDALIESAYRSDDIGPEDSAEDEGPDYKEDAEASEGRDSGLNAFEDSIPPRRRSRIWMVLLIFSLLLLAAGAGVWLLAPEHIPFTLPFVEMTETKAEDPGAKQLRLADISGRFINSEKAGPLFVINGTVINQYPGKRSFILLRGNLLDEHGKVVQTREAYAGNPFRDEELKTMTMEEIAAGIENRYGVGRNNFNIEPGASIPFTIVFDQLPAKLHEFTVDAVGSSPGM